MKRRNILEMSNDEKIRILSLHETERRKSNLIFEQSPTGDTKDNKFGPIPLGSQFEFGKYQSDAVKNSITNLKQKIESFISANTQYSTFEVRITAGESKVTNPKGFETKGSLALARANEVKKYFEEIFPDLIKNKKLVIKSPESVSDVVIGETPYGGAGSGDNTDAELVKKYKKEQYVNFEINGVGSSVTTTTTTTGSTTTVYGCDKAFSSSGIQGFGDINKDFSNNVPFGVSATKGTFSIWINCFTMPDVLYFEIDGKTDFKNNSSLFRGDDANWTRLFLGTALRAKYGGSLPSFLSSNYSVSVPKLSLVRDEIDKMSEWGLSTFDNIFGNVSPLKNDSWMNALLEYDRSEKNRSDKNKLFSILGGTFPWGYLNGDIIETTTIIGPYTVTDLKSPAKVKLINVSPNGKTNFEVQIRCEN
jgi:hypothetical protein